MFENKIEEYLSDHLIPLLSVYDLTDEIISKVVKDVNQRLYSIIFHWNDSSYRRTILEVNNELALHYKPNKKIQIRSLVVTSIRNSLLEELSCGCDDNVFNLNGQIISDEDIPKITSDAIEFFSGFDLSDLANHLGAIQNDIFGDLPTKYPATWTAFQNLNKGLNQKYEPIVAKEIDIDNNGSLFGMQHNMNNAVVMSGMNPKFDSKLADYLKAIKSGKAPYLYTDSFKTISRNPHKLFKVIEYVLAANSRFVTANYYIENGYVEKRENLLKPGHTVKDMIKNASNLKGVGRKHREVLKNNI